MLGCIYSGIKKSMTAHKYFAYSSLLCMGMDNLFDLLRQSLALVVDDSTINLFIGSVFKIILVPQGKENKDKERKFFVNYSHYYLI